MKAEITLLIRDAGNDTVREATGTEILEAARAYLSKRLRRGTTLSSPKATRDYLSLRFGMRYYETSLSGHMSIAGATSTDPPAESSGHCFALLNASSRLGASIRL